EEEAHATVIFGDANLGENVFGPIGFGTPCESLKPGTKHRPRGGGGVGRIVFRGGTGHSVVFRDGIFRRGRVHRITLYDTVLNAIVFRDVIFHDSATIGYRRVGAEGWLRRIGSACALHRD